MGKVLGRNWGFNKWGSVLLAGIIAANSFAWAGQGGLENTPLIVVEARSSQDEAGQEVVKTSVQVIEGGSEEAVIQEALRANPDAIITVFAPSEDSKHVSAVTEISEGMDNAPSVQVVKVSEDRLRIAAAQLLSQNPDIHSTASRKERIKEFAKGILVTVTTASGVAATHYGISMYYMTPDMLLTSKLFVLSLVIGGVQYMANDTWQKFLKAGGTVAKKVHHAFARMLGKAAGEARVTDSLGRIMAAFGFNMGVAATVLGMNDALITALYVMSLGAVGSWSEIWDLVTGKFEELGLMNKKQVKKFAAYKLFLAPPIEMIAYTGSPIAAVAAAVMAVIGATGLVSFFAANHIKEALAKRRGIKAEEVSVHCDQILKEEPKDDGRSASFWPLPNLKTFDRPLLA